uniref:G-protein coupled receptors family 1 profile domain-containing protein n=1 Tax=Scleropages formosus TaxID=113540 RepID=A0A8C9S0A2_SCLFO
IYTHNAICQKSVLFCFPSTLLVSMYTVALIGGTTGIVFMSLILKHQHDNLSITNISILNLVVAHGLFLLTLPFRIDYYITNYWRYCFSFCKLVSIAAHTHLYLTFFFYISILVVRFLPSFGWKPMHFQYPLIAFLFSATIWILFMVGFFTPLWIKYGKLNIYNETKCFKFHTEIKDHVVTINIMIAAIVLAVACTTLTIQCFILLKMVRANHCNLLSQQEFRAQLKNFWFISIMVICFLPYHIFRIYYVLNDTKNQQLLKYNETFLAISALCCLDLLTFISNNLYFLFLTDTNIVWFILVCRLPERLQKK